MKRLLILYDYFDPAYKAGGPIRSLVNFVKLFEGEMDIYILTTNQDHDGSYLDVVPDRWIKYSEYVKVQYLSKSRRNLKGIKQVIDEVNPDVVYLNGVFSISFVVNPLRILRKYTRVKKTIAPRGMLQKEALSIKPNKKKIYLNILKFFFLDKQIHWHVTTEQEHRDLSEFLSKKYNISLIGNVPSYDPDYIPKIPPVKDRIIFGTVALISPMKNIHLILSALQEIQDKVEYHLYGPVKDQVYWKECQQLIEKQPENIHVFYHGELNPGNVSDNISTFDFYIQPSRSENFGHSIFEAFNIGVPVIISDQTPWKGLKEKHAGWDVDLKEPDALIDAIQEAISLDNKSYQQYQQGARQIAENYMQSHNFKELYLKLFS